MELSAPKTITFLISVIVAIIAIVIRYLTHHANINLRPARAFKFGE